MVSLSCETITTHTCVGVCCDVGPKYMKEFLSLRCAGDLLNLGIFSSRKYLIRSMAIFNAARKYLVYPLKWNLEDKDVQVVVFGDGKRPRVASMFAHRTKWVTHNVFDGVCDIRAQAPLFDGCFRVYNVTPEKFVKHAESMIYPKVLIVLVNTKISRERLLALFPNKAIAIVLYNSHIEPYTIEMYEQFPDPLSEDAPKLTGLIIDLIDKTALKEDDRYNYDISVWQEYLKEEVC